MIPAISEAQARRLTISGVSMANNLSAAIDLEATMLVRNPFNQVVIDQFVDQLACWIERAKAKTDSDFMNRRTDAMFIDILEDEGVAVVLALAEDDGHRANWPSRRLLRRKL